MSPRALYHHPKSCFKGFQKTCPGWTKGGFDGYFSFLAKKGKAMKKSAFFSVGLAFLFSMSNLFAATYGGGSGTEDDPYQIWTAEQLNTIGANTSDWSKYFILEADINMSSYTGTSYNRIGLITTAGGVPIIKSFTGYFNGNGYVIKNLTYTTTASTTYVGMFGITGSSAVIYRVVLQNASISSAGDRVAGLVGSNGGTIQSCYCTGTITGGSASECVGGLTGYNSGTIELSHNSASVNGYSYVGGLAGDNSGTIYNSSYNAGDINGSGEYIGGIAGYNDSGIIKSRSYNVGPINGYKYVGGLVGYNVDGNITSCYSSSTVTATSIVGGIAGYSRGEIGSCSSSGTITATGSSTGGLVGINAGDVLSSGNYSIVSGCYGSGGLVGENEGNTIDCGNSGSVSGTSYVGGLVGFNHEEIKDCQNTASVKVNSASNSYTGGLVGYNNDTGDITNCFNTGDVCNTTSCTFIGGLTGYNGSTITACYNTGKVTGSYRYTAGLVGQNYYGTIESCYNAGAVSNSSSYVGGAVAWNCYGSLNCCYNSGSVSGTANVGGLVGYNYNGTATLCYWDTETSGQSSSSGGTGQTTSQMKSIELFILAGWDFVNYWTMADGQSYPLLKSFNGVNPADIDHSGTVDFTDFAILANHWLESD